ncbi:hypothetical protein KC19_VG310100 [Ceratodon purpureus]|uniref:Uncharacterized protein n=1 Tax=Ceratodon purpureus TaxID=3225 RepID=A0A8T0HVF8_CERPU|nr:hypothetical protein KC19_VG310100 [Ceratodon purpureus]
MPSVRFHSAVALSRLPEINSMARWRYQASTSGLVKMIWSSRLAMRFFKASCVQDASLSMVGGIGFPFATAMPADLATFAEKDPRSEYQSLGCCFASVDCRTTCISLLFCMPMLMSSSHTNFWNNFMSANTSSSLQKHPTTHRRC